MFYTTFYKLEACGGRNSKCPQKEIISDKYIFLLHTLWHLVKCKYVRMRKEENVDIYVYTSMRIKNKPIQLAK